MEGIIKFLTIILNVINYLAIIISLYYTFLGLNSLYKKRRKQVENGQRTFAIVIPAHNEQNVIKQTIQSCFALKYPKELFDVYVVADNCTDDTKRIAEESGAITLERFNKVDVGKGYTLKWFFNELFNFKKQYRTIVIIDADNIIHPDFLRVMNDKMNEGYQVVQGYLDSKNPYDSWVTAFYSLEFWGSNRMLKLSRDNLGLSAQLGGTGFTVDTDILKNFGWDATCLTEDLEFTCKLVLEGHKVGWAHNAIIYDEKPLTFKASWNQRKRWMQGYADVFSKYFFPLVFKGIKNFKMAMIDCAIYSIQPIMLIVFGTSALIGIIKNIYFLQDTLRNMAIIHPRFDMSIKEICYAGINMFQFLMIPLMLLFDGKLNFKMLITYILYPFYSLSWIPISILGIKDKNNKNWSHTEHTRAIEHTEIPMK